MLYFHPTLFLKDERRRQISHSIPVIVLAPNWRFFVIGSCEHTTNDILTIKTEPWNRTVWTPASNFLCVSTTYSDSKVWTTACQYDLGNLGKGRWQYVVLWSWYWSTGLSKSKNVVDTQFENGHGGGGGGGGDDDDDASLCSTFLPCR